LAERWLRHPQPSRLVYEAIFGGSFHIKNEILFDNPQLEKLCLILKAFFYADWDALFGNSTVARVPGTDNESSS